MHTVWVHIWGKIVINIVDEETLIDDPEIKPTPSRY
jgi:hypothetical protein